MGRTDEARMVINASTVRVYKALVTPEVVERWLPPAGMSCRLEEFEPRPGGAYRVVLTYDDASDAPGKSSDSEDVVEGRFVEIEPGVRVVQEFEFRADDPRYAGVMRMIWEVSAEGASTLVAVRAENVPSGIDAADHVAGMTSSLEQLARVVGR